MHENAIWSDRKKRKLLSEGVKSDSILWYAAIKSLTKVQELDRAKYRCNERTLKGIEIKKWHKNFQEKSVVTTKKVKQLTVNLDLHLQFVEQEAKNLNNL